VAVVELTGADNGRSIRVHPDDEIVVRLPENPTTGFRWEIERADPIVAVVGDDFELGRPGLVGAGGTHEFRFMAAGSYGSGSLSLKLRQAWEGDASVTDRFSVDLVVEA